MTIDVQLSKEGKRQIEILKDVEQKFSSSITESLDEIGDNLVRTAENQALNEPKFGREYKIKDDQGVVRLHRASQKGQSPAMLSGNYVDSFDYTSSDDQLEFGNSAEYAEYLEDEDVLDRPGLGNSVRHNIESSRDIFNRNIATGFDL